MNQNPEIMFHLVGEQAIPIFLAIIQFPKNVRHYLLTTESEKTKKTVTNLKATLDARGYCAEIYILGKETNATSFAAMNDQIKTVLKKYNPEGLPCSFNITGGTKPMSISAVLASNTFNPKPGLFYLNFYSREILWLDGNADPLTERMKLADFVLLAGLQLKTSEESELLPSDKFLNFLLCYAPVLRDHQFDFAQLGEKFNRDVFSSTFKKLEAGFAKKNGLELWRKYWSEYLESGEAKMQSEENQARFLGGIWLEYYTYSKLKDCPEICEVFHSAEFIDKQNAVRQEIDVIYTDGFSLVILECKAGNVKQEHIQKLENLRNVYSGAMGRGGIICINKSKFGKIVSSRVTDSKNIAAFTGYAGIDRLKENLFNFKPGHIYAE